MDRRIKWNLQSLHLAWHFIVKKKKNEVCIYTYRSRHEISKDPSELSHSHTPWKFPFPGTILFYKKRFSPSKPRDTSTVVFIYKNGAPILITSFVCMYACLSVSHTYLRTLYSTTCTAISIFKSRLCSHTIFDFLQFHVISVKVYISLIYL